MQRMLIHWDTLCFQICMHRGF